MMLAMMTLSLSQLPTLVSTKTYIFYLDDVIAVHCKMQRNQFICGVQALVVVVG